MIISQSPKSSTQHIAADGRIYNDSKGRPVGLAGIVNRITNTVDVPKKYPLQTPEDKKHLDMFFNKCLTHAENHLQSLTKVSLKELDVNKLSG